MIKLYKKDGDRLLYWETWEDGGKHTMHWGVVGDEGETQAVRSGLFRDAGKTVAEEMARQGSDPQGGRPRRPAQPPGARRASDLGDPARVRAILRRAKPLVCA